MPGRQRLYNIREVWSTGSPFYIRTSHAKHAVDHGQEINTFQYDLESSLLCIDRYTRIIHSRVDRDETHTFVVQEVQLSLE